MLSASDSISPSSHEGEAEDSIETHLETYSPGLDIELDVLPTERGLFLHRCFEVVGARPDLWERYLASSGISIDEETKYLITSAVAAFETWMQEYLAPARIDREWPLLGKTAEGSVLSGVADLVVETEEGLWVIDHKSDRVGNLDDGFRMYLPQLRSYAGVLVDSGNSKAVVGLAINWMHRGVVQHCRAQI